MFRYGWRGDVSKMTVSPTVQACHDVDLITSMALDCKCDSGFPLT